MLTGGLGCILWLQPLSTIEEEGVAVLDPNLRPMVFNHAVIVMDVIVKGPTRGRCFSFLPLLWGMKTALSSTTLCFLAK